MNGSPDDMASPEYAPNDPGAREPEAREPEESDASQAEDVARDAVANIAEFGKCNAEATASRNHLSNWRKGSASTSFASRSARMYSRRRDAESIGFMAPKNRTGERRFEPRGAD